MNRNLGNWRTTMLGASAGSGLYVGLQGFTLPTDRRGWLNLAVSILISLLGYFAKDAATGSRPGETK